MNSLSFPALGKYIDLLVDAVCVVDKNGYFLYVSPSAKQIFGYTQAEMMGKQMLELVHPDDRKLTLQTVDKIVAGEPQPHFENRYIRKDGETVHIMWSARWSEADQCRVAVARDITRRKQAEIERKQMMARLEHLALYDQLTRLPNRTLFYDRIHSAMARAKRNHGMFSLLYLDMDKFKAVNDNYGHTAGDLLLEQVARRLESCVRECDTVARFGGDEFVILLENIERPEQSIAVAQKVREGFIEPFDLMGHHTSIMPSIGVAHYPLDGENEQTLLRHADDAMYAAKSST